MSGPMKVIGLTDQVRGDAEEQCPEGFRAWIAEAMQGTWGSWEELKKQYPGCSQTGGDEAHFPLTADGTGIRAMIFFKLQLLILRYIATAPMTTRIPHRRRISLPTNTQTTRSIANQI